MCIAIPPPAPNTQSKTRSGWWQWLSATPVRLFGGAALVQVLPLAAALFLAKPATDLWLPVVAGPLASLSMGWLLRRLPLELGESPVAYVRYALLFFLQFPAGLLLIWGTTNGDLLVSIIGLLLTFAAWLMLWRHFHWRLQWAVNPAPRAIWTIHLLFPALLSALFLAFFLAPGRLEHQVTTGFPGTKSAQNEKQTAWTGLNKGFFPDAR